MSKEPAKQQTDQDYEPYANRDVEKPLSNLEASFHIIKITFGTGILALPKSVQRAGWILAIISTFLAGFVNTYALYLLTNTAYDLCVIFKKPSLTYGEILQYAVERIRPGKGNIGKIIADVMLFLYLISVTCAYLTFMATNITSVINAHNYNYTNQHIILMMIVFLILLNMIRNLKYMVPFTILGHILTIFVFLTLWYYMFRDEFSISDRKTFVFLELANFYGSVLFAINPVALVMSVENTMKDPRSFRKPIGTLTVTMIINTTLTACLAVLGYLRYGEDLISPITMNMPEYDALTQTAKISYVICIAIDFILNTYLLYEVVYKGWLSKYEWNKKLKWDLLFRALCIVLISAICVAIPDFQTFVNLAGSICFSSLGILIPALSTIFTKWSQNFTRKEKSILILKYGWIIVIAIFGMVVGTTSAIRDLFEFFEK